MTPAVAIVGMACRYPDAHSPDDLWDNVLAQRRAFRRMPSERLRLDDYLSADRNAPDRTYSTQAALIENYEFDRVRFRVAGTTFRSADLAHWVALDVADQALTNAGFIDGESLPRETTGVFLGNTLTGEFSRASVMRLRWPYVRRIVEAALIKNNWSPEHRHPFLNNLEIAYKEPFAPINEETLAGGLSNTIAGRICNHFDLKGGGYTVDGACASSLLAVINACSALVAGDLDVVLAGGVDLSLDPFELVGFAKAGALASGKMKIYDARSEGFWPGEGCGFVVLMRHDDAIAEHRRVYGIIRGWGISSDGRGGITRPEIDGQILALNRAYHRANFEIHTIAYFEGHGTGTSVGDATELKALSHALGQAARKVPLPAIGSIKANTGHTKAAAGIAGLIKATMALHKQILPPTTGCEELHPELHGENPALRVLREGESWPTHQPLRAGVSAMGFGGINTHVVLEGAGVEQRSMLSQREQILLSSAQDAELLLLGEQSTSALLRRVDHLLTFADRLSFAEISDLAVCMVSTLGSCRVRAAIVAGSPAELTRGLKTLRAWLADKASTQLNTQAGVFLSSGINAPRIGFLFPGQGSPAHLEGGALRRRFDFVRALYAQVNLSVTSDGVATDVAQPAIVTASLAGLRALNNLGISAQVAVGHSLGEITALHWAGALSEEALLRIATVRGQAMAELGNPAGAMASISAGQPEVEALLNGEPVVIAGLNSPRQTIISGPETAVAAFVARARTKGINAVKLPVSHAFHSPLVAAVGPALAEHLEREEFHSLQRVVASTVTGVRYEVNEDLRKLLYRQVTSPVRFMEAVSTVADGLDLLIEVGPGNVLSGLVTEFANTPVIALDAGGLSLRPFLQAVGAAFVLGVKINYETLFGKRFTRPFDLNWRPRFFTNPCELAPVPEESGPEIEEPPGSNNMATSSACDLVTEPPLALVRRLIANRTELPFSAIHDDSRLLGDLHLNSISVGQLVVEATRCLGISPPVAPTDYSDETVANIACALEERIRTGDSYLETNQQPSGVDSWIRVFTVEMLERALPTHKLSTSGGRWRLITVPDYPLRDSLQHALDDWGRGNGVIVCLPPGPDERHVTLLLEAAHAALSDNETTHFVLVQHGGGAASFARTLHLESPGITTCVVDVPENLPDVAGRVLAEIKAAVGYSEAHYDNSGTRREPVLRLLPISDEAGEILLGPNDVLLVTGGGKGIAAECALSLARETRVRLALLGRSRPEDDTELATNLQRIAAAGVAFKYIAADVTVADEVRIAIREVNESLGPITAVLHGAGANVPQLLGSLDETAFLRTLAPKVQGARNVLAAVDGDRLRLFVTFGSLIARTGMRGEADYAVANEWLTSLTERWQRKHPHCRCLAVEWSIWSGVGMGQRLGRVDALMQQGITPIPTDDGIRILRQLLGQRLPSVSVVVTGRYGEAPTLKVQQPELPLLRFLEQPRVYYPGIELIADVKLSTDSDLYLNDHVFQGERLLPAVMGLEAMAQVATALVRAEAPPVFEDVKFNRPIVVPDGAVVTIRLAALVREPNLVEVALRSEETSFQIDHFHAVCRFGSKDSHYETQFAPDEFAPINIDPDVDLYGGILFQQGRFRRLRGYRLLQAKECLAEIKSGATTDWFSRYLPARLLLGDPGARDSAIHAIQACIPHVRVLPVGVDEFVPAVTGTSDPHFVHATERSCEGDTFTYDLQVIGANGCLLERWEGLRLRCFNGATIQGEWVEPLLGPYLERRVSELIPEQAVSIVVDHDAKVDLRVRSDRAIQRAKGETVSVLRRPDGKPEVTSNNGVEVSVSHAGDTTIAVAGKGPLGCDIESVVDRPTSVWRALLGTDRYALAKLVAREADEDQTVAATRIWSAIECLKKAGSMIGAPLVLVSSVGDGWVNLASGPLIITTVVAQVRGDQNRQVLALLIPGEAQR
ncbi:MAG TPA: SDR family NAD(P)-dependent oxidoreductase [Pyrinomonadaceae bacterium]|jgi:enediyne polyketide synthase